MATSNPTQVTQYQTGFAPEIAPYAQQLLGAAAGQIYDYARDAQGNVIYDATGMPRITGMRAPATYPGERVAEFSDLQKQAFRDAELLGVNTETSKAAQDAAKYASQAAGIQYTPGTFQNQFRTPAQYQPGTFSYRDVNAPALSQYQMAAPERAQGIAAIAQQMGPAPTAKAAQMQGPADIGYERVGAERVSAPSVRDLSMQAAAPVSAERVGTPTMRAAQTGYQPSLQQYQMQAPSERVTAQSFVQPGTAESFMSPYMQAVVDKQTREAIRQADIAATSRGARFAQAGAFGGGRQAIEEAEARRNLATQLGDIQATGLQSAYQQAQQQFNQEQAARQAAQQANIGSALTVGQQNLAAQLGVQQLGTQTGAQLALANLSNEQQAAVQNQAAQLQAQGLNAQQALQAALANQGVQQQANLQNLSAGLQTQGLQAQTGLQAQQLNQQAGLQALLANQQAGLQTGQFKIGRAHV